jgi:hypothetical protein
MFLFAYIFVYMHVYLPISVNPSFFLCLSLSVSTHLSVHLSISTAVSSGLYTSLRIYLTYLTTHQLAPLYLSLSLGSTLQFHIFICWIPKNCYVLVFSLYCIVLYFSMQAYISPPGFFNNTLQLCRLYIVE